MPTLEPRRHDGVQQRQGRGRLEDGFCQHEAKGVAEVFRSRTKAGSDENYKDGRDSHPYSSVVVITGIARWRCSCGAGSSCGLQSLSSDHVGYMLHSGHFEDLSVASALDTRVGDFAEPRFSHVDFDDLLSSLENEEMKLTRSERQKLQRFYLSTIDPGSAVG